MCTQNDSVRKSSICEDFASQYALKFVKIAVHTQNDVRKLSICEDFASHKWIISSHRSVCVLLYYLLYTQNDSVRK